MSFFFPTNPSYLDQTDRFYFSFFSKIILNNNNLLFFFISIIMFNITSDDSVDIDSE